MSEKPLHVRVAEAIHPEWVFFQTVLQKDHPSGGQCYLSDREWSEPGEWIYRDGPKIEQPLTRVPRYDTDWSVTGPLIETLGISLWNDDGWEVGFLYSAEYEGYWLNDSEEGATPLLAVCNLILALSEAGKLEAK